MRGYGQYCALAKALDVVGDRWTLLIVRELQVGPRRYRDLLAGLPGIATNLLADRLKALEAAGLVEHDEESATYTLTSRGHELRASIGELMRWGLPLMLGGQGDDEFRLQWLPLAVGVIYEEKSVDPPVKLVVRTESGTVEMKIGDKEVRSRMRGPRSAGMSSGILEIEPWGQCAGESGAVAASGSDGLDSIDARAVDAVLDGPPAPILGVLTGQIPLEDGEAFGVEVTGDRSEVERLLAYLEA